MQTPCVPTEWEAMLGELKQSCTELTQPRGFGGELSATDKHTCYYPFTLV